MCHGAIRMNSVAEGRVRGEPVKEGEKRGRRKRKRVKVNEVGNMMGCEGWENFSEGWVERVINGVCLRSVDDGF